MMIQKSGKNQTRDNTLSLEYVTCDLCESIEFEHVYSKGDDTYFTTLFDFPVVRCKNCKLTFVNPRPSSESMRAFYPKPYYERGSAENTTRYEAYMSWIRVPPSARVCEVGCGRGDFLKLLIEKHQLKEAVGIDPYAASFLDIDAKFFKSTLVEAKLESGSFDVIMAWAVLEHVHEPLKYFKEISRILKPGGHFYCLVTNANSIYGRFAYKEDVPRHLYHFSKRSLNEYAYKVGLQLDTYKLSNSIYNGRGNGTFSHWVRKLVRLPWYYEITSQSESLRSKIVNLGKLLDRVIFRGNWEETLGISGIAHVSFIKSENG